MGKFKARIQRMHYAGWRNASRAIGSRLWKKIAETALVRRIIPLAEGVTEEQFRHSLGLTPNKTLEQLFLDSSPAAHFLDDPQALAACVRQGFPHHVDQTIAQADAICAHRFSFLGKSAQFRAEIDWHWCPESGGSWPKLPSSGYLGANSYYREDRPGDVKYPWELNRHQYFVTLGKAYQYTGDEQYAREFIAQLLHWTQENPYRVGMNWVSTMEVGIRLIAWLNAFWLMRDAPCVREHLDVFLKGCLQHARHVDRYLTTDWLVTTNHLIGEAAALYAFAVLFPQFRESAGWRRKALRVFVREVERQTFSDGVNKEQATGYHRFVVDFILLVLRLSDLNRIAVPPVLRARLKAMLDYEQYILPPDNRAPQIGDCDDGRGFILDDQQDFFDFRGWQAVGAVWFDRSDFARAAQGGAEEAIWFLGPDSWQAFRAMTGAAESRHSRLFREGGQAILRTGDESRDHFAFLRCGPFGLGGDGASSHSHADLLALVIHWHGRPLAVDAGTYQYLCETAWRDRFRGGLMHNGVLPRGMDQAPIHPLKGWGAVPHATVTQWESNTKESRVSARMKAPSAYTHERTVTLTPDRLEISDVCTLVAGRRADAIDWRLHLHPDCQAEPITEGFLLRRGGAAVARLRFSGYDSSLLEDSWYSPAYGVKTPSTCIVLTAEGASLRGTVTLESVDGRP